MPWSGGTFSLLYNWISRRDAGLPTKLIDADTMTAQDQDFADGLEECVKRNGDIAATANLPMGGFLHTNVGAATARTNYARVAELQDQSHQWIAGSGTDTITATYAPAVTVLTNGMRLNFRAAAANATTTPTFAPNGLTAKTIVKGANVALVAGDIAGQHHECIVQYNSTTDKWHLLNPTNPIATLASYALTASVQTSAYTWVDGGGTADAITATYSPALAALTDGTLIGVRATAANATTTPTFAPNGLTAKTIVKGANVALTAGDIEGNSHELLLRYAADIDKWVLLNPKYPAGVSGLDLNSLTTDATGGAVGDFIPFVDISDSNASNKVTMRDMLYNYINAETADTAPDHTADHVLTCDNSASAPKKVLLRYIGAGKQTVWVPAGAMTTRTTNGAAAGTTESTTNKIMRRTFDFDQSTDEFAQFTIAMPKGWNESTVTAQFVWECGVTGNVVWGLQGVAISDDDLVDAAFGTAQTVTDGVTATTDVMVSAETSAITLAGTPAEGDLVVFQVYRDADNGSDTAAGDAKLLGVRLFYTTDNSVDD